MSRNRSYEIVEYGVIRSLEDYEIDPTFNSLKELYLPKKHFEDLFSFIMQNQGENNEGDRIFSLFTKGRKRQIKTKNYVGVIETHKGLVIELLPKIFFSYNNYKSDLEATKKVFLKMLSKLKDSPFLNISSAHIKTQQNFPLLEIFIENYIDEIKTIVRSGIKSEYIDQQDNLKYLRGKINYVQDIKINHSNKANFYCQYDEFSENTVFNQLIKSTLLKLRKLSKSNRNRTSIFQLLHYFDSIDESKDIINDFKKVNNNRLLTNYKLALSWSAVFLMNKSFSSFSGNAKNLSILFPMERIFEDYVGFLMKKYATNFEVKTQDQSYHLVEQHNFKNKFRLKPDIVATNNTYEEQIIFDTKWKLLDESKESKNYYISQADMYQLYAYGKKYALKNSFSNSPKLVLIYPSTAYFKNPLNKFTYEIDLELYVFPFNLKSALSINDEKREIYKLLEFIKQKDITNFVIEEKSLSMVAEDSINYGMN